MSSQQFQSTHDQIHQLSTNLLHYLQELRAGQLSEGDDTKGLQTVENEINTALNALKTQKYQVAVVAAMKAGKSTFLNVLIGADILASESEACTVCRTDIKPIDHNQTPRLLEYQEGKREPVVIVEGEASEIRHQFLARTRQIRDTNNPDKTVRFELEHPIEAISKLPSLNGFTLVDTPGPNEWQSAEFNTIALKRTALEALRTCDAILFILDYSSFKDDTNSELLKELIEQRQEALKENTGKLYFILNKVDRKAEKDRPIENVIEDLRNALISFGIPEPIIYPASAWQGLLSKLIQGKVATKEHKEDFKKFFIARYMTEDEEGDLYVPKMADIAPQALSDSHIPEIEQSVIQTVVKNSGWNLLSDVLNELDKAAKAIEDSLNTQIQGWKIEFESLKKKVEEYQKKSESSKVKVQAVKDAVEEQKKILIEGFSQGVLRFAEGAKEKIEQEILQISSLYSSSRPVTSTPSNFSPRNIESPIKEMNFRFRIPEWLPFIGGTEFVFESKTPLVDSIRKAMSTFSDDLPSDETSHSNPYAIRVKTQEQGEMLVKTINDFCTPHLQDWWIVTQDKLILDGTKIREELVKKIQQDIQAISDELSDYLGQALNVDMNINDIQFPNFDFLGIDAQVRKQQEIYYTKREVTKYDYGQDQGFCEGDDAYRSRIAYTDYESIENKRDYHEVDLLQTVQSIKQNIDSQTSNTITMLTRVIEKQIKEDFRNAEKQINDYIQKFQDEFNNLVKQRQVREADAPKILAMLEQQKSGLIKYLSEIREIRQSLDTWKPN